MIIVPASQTAWACGIDSLESIPGLFKSLKIRALPTIWWFMWALGSEGETNSNSTNSVNICKNAKKSADYVLRTHRF